MGIRKLVLSAALAAVSMLVMASSALAWTPTSLTMSCGQIDVSLPDAGTYNYSVTGLPSGTITTTTSPELVTIGGVYGNGLKTAHVWHGTETGTSTSYLFVNCEQPVGKEGPAGPAGPAGPKGDTGKEGAKGETGVAGTPGLTGLTAIGAPGPAGIPGIPGVAGPCCPKVKSGTKASHTVKKPKKKAPLKASGPPPTEPGRG